jgi:hypothetical protein
MDTNLHYGHQVLSVRDGRSLRVATFFWLSRWGMHPLQPLWCILACMQLIVNSCVMRRTDIGRHPR